MWDKIVNLAIDDGIWALLFCFLLIFELKDSRAREQKYQKTIAELSQDLGYMNVMNKNIDRIHEEMRAVLDRGKRTLKKENV